MVDVGNCTSCPLPEAHKRLEDVHISWHEAVNQYCEPDAFRRNLNHAIQELRNVSWVLQAEKDVIPGFESWYEEWRNRFRADARMKWIVKARNTIVKKSDLSKLSTARITLVPEPSFRGRTEYLVPADAQPHEIARILVEKEGLREFNLAGLLIVERRWVSTELPDDEILGVLAHGFGRLCEMLWEAHERCNSQFRATTCGGEIVPSEYLRALNWKLPCMEASDEDRRAYFDVRKMTSISEYTDEVPILPSGEVTGRYGIELQKLKRMQSTGIEGFIEGAANLIEVAKKILEKDGNHKLMVHVLGQTKSAIVALDPGSREGELLFWEKIAVRARELAAGGIVVIGEFSHVPSCISIDKGDLSRVRQGPGIGMVVVGPNGREVLFWTPYERNESEYRFEPTHRFDNPGVAFLQPLWEIWANPERHS